MQREPHDVHTIYQYKQTGGKYSFEWLKIGMILISTHADMYVHFPCLQKLAINTLLLNSLDYILIPHIHK